MTTDKKVKPGWEKGKSGNPGGRSPRVGPNGETVAQLARAHTAEAVAVLREGMNDKTSEWKDRIVAANAMLDRGWGRPKNAEEDGEPKDKGKAFGEELLALLGKKLPD